MSAKVVYFLISFCVAFVLASDKSNICTTPNGEVANCVSINECSILRKALSAPGERTREFARKSLCGRVGKLPLVCCGNTAEFTSIAPPKSCTTPNGESATCASLSSCKIISNALQTRNRDAIKFSQDSKCDEEQQVCCGSDGYPLRTNLLPNRSACGEQKGDVRIIGGEQTEIFEFPWMALFMYKFHNGSDAGFRCGGSIVNNRYVLTAAHCVSVPAELQIYLDKVRLGEWRISTAEDCEAKLPLNCADPVVDLNIEEKIVHPQYNSVAGKNDIALLRLERNVQYTNYIQPICLPVRESAYPDSKSEMHVAGWGATENSSNSDVKLKVKLLIASRNYCNERLSSIGGIDSTQVCAGGEGGKDSCQGDSGGPLMRSSTSENLNAKPKWFQEGIVSRGIKCGLRGVPGIYTRVAHYMDWIIQNLKSF